jgi:agmatinase
MNGVMMLPKGPPLDFDPDGPAEDGLYGVDCPLDDALVHVIAVPWQATASYRRGTRHGPAAIFRASGQIDLHDVSFGPVYKAGLAWIDGEADIGSLQDSVEDNALAVIEAGGAGDDPLLVSLTARVTAAGDQVNARVGDLARKALAAGRIPAVVGGDHSSPFGLIEAVARHYPQLGVLHLDAHADLRSAYLGFRWSHASIFHNVLEHCPSVERLVGVGWRDMGRSELERIAREPGRISAWTDQRLADAQLSGRSFADVVNDIVAELPPFVHISIDIDGLDPTLCPNTGTPVPGGVSWREVELLLRTVAQTRTITSFDLCEVGPGPGGVTEEDTWDAIVGARLLYKLCGAAVVSRQRAQLASEASESADSR